MDKLPQDKQAEIKKLSTERLIACLARAGTDKQVAMAMDRPGLLEAWAEMVADGRDKPPHGPSVAVESETKTKYAASGADPDLQKRLLEFDLMKFEEEMKIREEEREERRMREERELKIREEERELRLKELQLREQELVRQVRKEKEEGERKRSLASRTKFFGEAMKNVFWKFPPRSG